MSLLGFHPVSSDWEGLGSFRWCFFLIFGEILVGSFCFGGICGGVCRSGVDHSIASSAWNQLCLPFESSLFWFFVSLHLMVGRGL